MTAATASPSPLTYMRGKMTEAEEIFRNGLTQLSGETDLLVIARDLLALCEDVASELRHLAPIKPLACRAGCDTCCRNIIQVRPLFAILAVFEAQQRFSPDQFQNFVNRLIGPPAGCPFLSDGHCSIYQVRPMVCRGYYSFDLALCQQGEYCEKDLGYQGEQAHAAHQLMVFLFSLEKRLEAIEGALGLDQNPVFLDQAARVLLGLPGATGRWLSGEKLFSQS